MTLQLIKFALVGITNNLVGYSIYLGLTSIGSEPKITMSFLYCVGVIIGYYGHKSLTFRQRSETSKSELIRYFFASVFGYVLNLSMLIIFVDKVGYPHQIVQAFGILSVALTYYFLMKYFVFTKQDTESCNS